MIGLRRGVVGKTVDPNLKLELKFNSQVFTDLAATVAAGADDYVRSWRSTVGGHLLTQATDAARPQRLSDGIYFNGGDGMTAPFSLATRIAWTIEGWEHDTNNSGNVVLVSFVPEQLYVNWVASTFYVGDGAANAIAFATTRPVATWYHVAVSFDGTTYRLFINGILMTSSTTALVSITTTAVNVGYRPLISSFMLGKLTDVRIYNVAKYTANFTPPTRSA